MTKRTIKEEMLFTNKKIFGDNNEHEYLVTCEDGIATAVPTESELAEGSTKVPKRLTLTYPKLEELSKTKKRICLEFRGKDDTEECDYADVCMKYGKISKN